ncbi:hypothetical protein PIROE2DRAFT_10863 [Piromyces sp. E2]|nr:hypothetical protein PIROE2DRAFT_10863 [Piromyces sp. E2]|eukprot:OUM62763.1 hypothetical protein PIROE2DRAFT_10863 [Piromyces sp. E2]
MTENKSINHGDRPIKVTIPKMKLHDNIFFGTRFYKYEGSEEVTVLPGKPIPKKSIYGLGWEHMGYEYITGNDIVFQGSHPINIDIPKYKEQSNGSWECEGGAQTVTLNPGDLIPKTAFYRMGWKFSGYEYTNNPITLNQSNSPITKTIPRKKFHHGGFFGNPHWENEGSQPGQHIPKIAIYGNGWRYGGFEEKK